ncbi:unnamed protein product [Closterium sp. Naga37s-1]|nr:unnamed protein product [Closterium sp. Naga37s-1]
MAAASLLDEIADELQALEAVYGDVVRVHAENAERSTSGQTEAAAAGAGGGSVVRISVELKPQTGEDATQQFVEATAVLLVSPQVAISIGLPLALPPPDTRSLPSTVSYRFSLCRWSNLCPPWSNTVPPSPSSHCNATYPVGSLPLKPIPPCIPLKLKPCIRAPPANLSTLPLISPFAVAPFTASSPSLHPPFPRSLLFPAPFPFPQYPLSPAVLRLSAVKGMSDERVAELLARARAWLAEALGPGEPMLLAACEQVKELLTEMNEPSGPLLASAAAAAAAEVTEVLCAEDQVERRKQFEAVWQRQQQRGGIIEPRSTASLTTCLALYLHRIASLGHFPAQVKTQVGGSVLQVVGRVGMGSEGGEGEEGEKDGEVGEEGVEGGCMEGG